MDYILNWFKTSPLRLIGGFLVFLSVGLLFFLVLLDIVAGLKNPYLGIVTYMILPGVLAVGLLLVPVDLWLQRRRRRAGLPEYPVIDLCNPHQRRIVGFFSMASVVILVIMTVVSYKAVEFMDTKTFCGTVCHKVMDPEYTAYNMSPHSSVPCIECHIGPGAPWFVRAKISGMPQVWHYTLKDYPRPLETPVQALRPSRDTCENCHSVGAFYGNTLRTVITYDQDKANTRVVKTQLMHVGSGGVSGSGIHSHMISKVDYLPAVKNYSEIAWVRVRRPDGTSQEFVNPTYQDKLTVLKKDEKVRRMDCIDCHNRAAHDFEPFENVLDSAMTERRVDPSLPFIKDQAMTAVGTITGVPTQGEEDSALKKIRAIPDYYEKNLPDVFKSRSADIKSSVKGIETALKSSMFPHMRIVPGTHEEGGTYPNWRTHEGCFRCHGTMVALGKGRDKEIPNNCHLCHTDQTEVDLSKLFTTP